MYLLIKKTGRNKTPLKLFQTIDRAIEELENYVKDSGFEWNWYTMGIKSYEKRYGTVKNTELIGPEIFTGTKYLVLAPEGIKKHSSNILDLIEIGDYVNGYKVRAVYLDGERHYIKLNGIEHARIYDDDIKSIVTHESFNSIKYEVI